MLGSPKGSPKFSLEHSLVEHSNSQQHHDAISAEHLQRLSTFHREITEKENTAHDVLFKAFYSLYWLAKEEIPNRKFTSLLSLLEHLGLKEMKHLNHRSPCAVREMFLVVGQVIFNSILQKFIMQIFGGCYVMMLLIFLLRNSLFVLLSSSTLNVVCATH